LAIELLRRHAAAAAGRRRAAGGRLRAAVGRLPGLLAPLEPAITNGAGPRGRLAAALANVGGTLAGAAVGTLANVGGALAGAAVGRLALGALALVPVEAPRRRGEVVETLDVRLVPSYL